eukprot:493968-Amphidinium_carterae.1
MEMLLRRSGPRDSCVIAVYVMTCGTCELRFRNKNDEIVVAGSCMVAGYTEEASNIDAHIA